MQRVGLYQSATNYHAQQKLQQSKYEQLQLRNESLVVCFRFLSARN